MTANGKILSGALALALLGAASAYAAPPPGRLLAAQCAQCHGTNGLAVSGMEKLAGESEGEIYKELIEMKAKLKPGEIMHRQAAGYSDEQIRLIARYYASLGKNGTTASGGASSKTRKSRDD